MPIGRFDVVMVDCLQKEKGPESVKPSGPRLRKRVRVFYCGTIRLTARPAEALASRRQQAQVRTAITRTSCYAPRRESSVAAGFPCHAVCLEDHFPILTPAMIAND